MGSEKGFTLIELVVVLAIAALLLAIVLPFTFNRRGRDELSGGAREIAGALRLARSQAIIENRPVRFVVDIENGFYRAPGASAAHAVPAGSHISLYTAQEEQLNGTTGAIRFFPDGSSTGGGIGLSLGAERYDILVDWLTGGVSIHARTAVAAR
jgi:general secretion pathway protein H